MPRRSDFDGGREREIQTRAYRLLGNYRGFVLRHYRILPTDPRFLALTDAECAELFWLEIMARSQAKLHASGADDTSMEALLWDAEFAKKEAELDARLKREHEAKLASVPPPVPEPMPVIPTETVSGFTADPSARLHQPVSRRKAPRR